MHILVKLQCSFNASAKHNRLTSLCSCCKAISSKIQDQISSDTNHKIVLILLPDKQTVEWLLLSLITEKLTDRNEIIPMTIVCFIYIYIHTYIHAHIHIHIYNKYFSNNTNKSETWVDSEWYSRYLP